MVAGTVSDRIHNSEGISVIVPAYNEQGAVAAVIGELLEQFRDGHLPGPYEIIVVDDASADSTAVEATTAGATVIRHYKNRGYGASIKTGLKSCKYETVVITDADSTYPARYIPELIALLESCDMAVGARKGANVNIPLERRPAKWVLRQTAEFLSGEKIQDLNSGLRAFRRADAMQYLNLYPSGFSFTTTITLTYLSDDLAVRYIPIDYLERVGKSKLRPIRDTKNLFLTVVRCVLLFNPLRVTIPIVVILVLLAVHLALNVRDEHGWIYDGTITILITCAMQILIIGFLADILNRTRR